LENYNELIGLVKGNSSSEVSESNSENDSSESNELENFSLNIRKNSSALQRKLSKENQKEINNNNNNNNNKENNESKFTSNFKDRNEKYSLVSIPKSRKRTTENFTKINIPIFNTGNNLINNTNSFRKSLTINNSNNKNENYYENEDKNNYQNTDSNIIFSSSLPNSLNLNDKKTDSKYKNKIDTNSDNENDNDNDFEDYEEYNNNNKGIYYNLNYKNVEISNSSNLKSNTKNNLDSLVTSVKKTSIDSVNKNKKNSIQGNNISNNITKNTEEINTNDNQVQKLTNTEEIKDFYEYTEECLRRIIKLKVPSNDEIKDLLFDLPFENELINKKLAIFDLDETLIHCEARKPSKAQKQIMCNLPNGGQAKVKNNNKIKKKFLIYFFDIYIYRLALTLDLIGKNACKKFPKIT